MRWIGWPSARTNFLRRMANLGEHAELRLVVSVTSGEAGRALAGCVPGLDDPALDNIDERRRRHDEIDGAVSHWAMDRVDTELLEELRVAGVAAATVRHSSALLTDPQLTAREFWQWAEGEVVGRQPNPSAPYRIDGRYPEVRWQAPTLGRHNREVLHGMLGLSDDELARLASDGIIGTRPTAKS